MRLFRGLRGKLTFTYILVTVLALLALEILVMFFSLWLYSAGKFGLDDYLDDVVFTLYPRASEFLQPGKTDLPGLQKWLQGVYDSGYASLPPNDVMDSPIARIVRTKPMIVLSPEKIVIAEVAPEGMKSLVGQPYVLSDMDNAQQILQTALDKNFASLRLAAQDRQGNYLLAVPVTQGDKDAALVAVILLTITAPPPMLLQVWPMLVGGVFITAFLLLMAIIPFATLFGFVMSRSLTRRLKVLVAAADAWGEGNFQSSPMDRADDEIGFLAQRMRNMAERIQDLLKTQTTLSKIEERNRLARELHDTVKQQTFATLMQVRSAQNLLEKDPQKARVHLEEAENLIKASQKELGLIISELHPAVLDEQPLSEALQAYVATWMTSSRILAEVQVQNERRLSMQVEQALYRVAQEALSNVVRHSHASAVSLALIYEPEKVTLSVIDNGIGIDPKQAGGFGIQSMRERLAALDGQLLIESKAGEGTKVMGMIPLKKKGEGHL